MTEIADEQLNPKDNVIIFCYLYCKKNVYIYSIIYAYMIHVTPVFLNILRLRRDGRHFPDDIFECIFLNENVWTLIKISLKFIPKGPVNDIPVLV